MSTIPITGTGLTRRVLRAPFQADTWARTLYALVGLPLAVVGFVFALVSLVLGAALSITFIGLPIIVLSGMACRQFGRWHRGLARTLLGERVGEPPPFRPGAWTFGWLLSGLADRAAWRARLYLILKLPVAVLSFAFSVMMWVYALGLIGDPLRWKLADEPFEIGSFQFDTWPRSLLISAAGILLGLAAPWTGRGILTVDRLLVRALLGQGSLTERVRQLEQHRAHAVDDSAAALRRIERDLHDGAQARLVALSMKLGLAKEELARPDAELAVQRAGRLVDSAQRFAQEALTELRDLARGIHPPVLDQGLDAALTTLASRGAIPIALHVDLRDRPSPAIETIAYFCVAELLTNVARHSGARHSTVELTQHGDTVRLVVCDNGRGGARIGEGTGLPGLAERVSTVDGLLEVTSPPGGPTAVTIELPIHV